MPEIMTRRCRVTECGDVEVYLDDSSGSGLISTMAHEAFRDLFGLRGRFYAEPGDEFDLDMWTNAYNVSREVNHG